CVRLCSFVSIPLPPSSTLFPYTTLFRSGPVGGRLHHPVLQVVDVVADPVENREVVVDDRVRQGVEEVVGSLLEGVLYAEPERCRDRKSTRLNSSHQIISYAVFCLKKKSD